MGVGEFAERISLIGMTCEGSVTSWGRSEKHNRAVGGKPLSGHRLFLGVDMVFDTPAGKVRAAELAKKLGLTATDEGDHTHLEPADY